MQFLTQLFTRLVFCLGLMITVISCVFASVLGSGFGGVPIIGITLMIISAVLWRKTSTKVCPECAERVKYQARKCRYCGADLVG
jgi:ribosomal protein L40E